MELKEIIQKDLYYYTNVFPNAKEILKAIEELDSDPRSYEVIEK
jgi:hypothetical protein